MKKVLKTMYVSHTFTILCNPKHSSPIRGSNKKEGVLYMTREATIKEDPKMLARQMAIIVVDYIPDENWEVGWRTLWKRRRGDVIGGMSLKIGKKFETECNSEHVICNPEHIKQKYYGTKFWYLITGDMACLVNCIVRECVNFWDDPNYRDGVSKMDKEIQIEHLSKIYLKSLLFNVDEDERRQEELRRKQGEEERKEEAEAKKKAEAEAEEEAAEERRRQIEYLQEQEENAEEMEFRYMMAGRLGYHKRCSEHGIARARILKDRDA